MTVIMNIIDILKKFFEGRDWYITFFTLMTWVLLLVIIIYTVCQLILLIFKVRYKNEQFINEVNNVKKRKNA
ncbi:hypothetical protein [Clostridium folliculivorans]|uniref:Uncharacterized protein n=1 Tax=Clostridium folliculivorans TaxID=2886038 RepID=A0A9W6D926_9CLOT|nr:hypothetical protein [Clostridium folliculivorans]GKU23253.1 hypothetical protein CFOLD11_00790 [Clostridium folliculivorans]GKU29370.1 hypothetical protein CFB3_14760 [Clostridium folliculivorans]